MKYYIIAGEASGDLHGSNLIHELKNVDNQADFRVWGGDLMQAQGAKLVKHYKHHSFMGVVDVVLNIRTLLHNFKFCYRDIVEYQPDVVILIDYPGFNMKVAKFAKSKGFKVYYYISPKVWVWKKKRVFDIKKYVDRMFTIFPFETEFYQQYDYKVDYVGNPLLDEIEKRTKNSLSFESFVETHNLDNKPIIALLPGSRKSEINMLLPEMMEVSTHYKDYQFVIAATPAIDTSLYEKYTQGYNVKLIYNQTYELLQQSKAALVTSGTATLETALLDVPQVVCFKFGSVSYEVGKHFIKVKYFSLVNIIMNSEVVRELLQYNLAQDMKAELDKILYNADYHSTMKNNYALLREKIGESGASRRAAELIVKSLTLIE